MMKNGDFGQAIRQLKDGKQVVRAGWNGKNMWLQLISPDCWLVTIGIVPNDTAGLDLAPWIGMRTADCKFVPWLASQTDVLAEDWEVLE